MLIAKDISTYFHELQRDISAHTGSFETFDTERRAIFRKNIEGIKTIIKGLEKAWDLFHYAYVQLKASFETGESLIVRVMTLLLSKDYLTISC